jgi:hypothetical protein
MPETRQAQVEAVEKHLDNIATAVAELKRNACLMDVLRSSKPGGWYGVDIGGLRGKALMEMRHDLDDALQSIKALEELEEG